MDSPTTLWPVTRRPCSAARTMTPAYTVMQGVRGDVRLASGLPVACLPRRWPWLDTRREGVAMCQDGLAGRFTADAALALPRAYPLVPALPLTAAGRVLGRKLRGLPVSGQTARPA